MNSHLIDRIGIWIVSLGALASAVCFAVFGVDTGIAAMAGAATASGNWLGMRLVSGYLAKRRVQSVGLVLALSTLKLALLIVVCYLLLRRLELDVMGFLIGLSTLVIGTSIGGLGGAAESVEEGSES